MNQLFYDLRKANMADQTAAEDNIKVVARVRPVTGTASKLAVSVPSSTKLLVGGQTFNFDHVAGTNASQVCTSPGTLLCSFRGTLA